MPKKLSAEGRGTTRRVGPIETPVRIGTFQPSDLYRASTNGAVGNRRSPEDAGEEGSRNGWRPARANGQRGRREKRGSGRDRDLGNRSRQRRLRLDHPPGAEQRAKVEANFARGFRPLDTRLLGGGRNPLGGHTFDRTVPMTATSGQPGMGRCVDSTHSCLGSGIVAVRAAVVRTLATVGREGQRLMVASPVVVAGPRAVASPVVKRSARKSEQCIHGQDRGMERFLGKTRHKTPRCKPDYRGGIHPTPRRYARDPPIVHSGWVRSRDAFSVSQGARQVNSSGVSCGNSWE